MALSPAHVLLLRWLAAYPGQSTAELASALGEPGDVDAVEELCRELEARGFIARVPGTAVSA